MIGATLNNEAAVYEYVIDEKRVMRLKLTSTCISTSSARAFEKACEHFESILSDIAQRYQVTFEELK